MIQLRNSPTLRYGGLELWHTRAHMRLLPPADWAADMCHIRQRAFSRPQGRWTVAVVESLWTIGRAQCVAAVSDAGFGNLALSSVKFRIFPEFSVDQIHKIHWIYMIFQIFLTISWSFLRAWTRKNMNSHEHPINPYFVPSLATLHTVTHYILRHKTSQKSKCWAKKWLFVTRKKYKRLPIYKNSIILSFTVPQKYTVLL